MRIAHEIIPLADLVHLWVEHYKLAPGETVFRKEFFRGSTEKGQEKIALTIYIHPTTNGENHGRGNT